MWRVVLVAALLVEGACWTGADHTAVEPPATPQQATSREPLRLRVKLERTACLGACPAYTVTLSGNGRVDWVGHGNVAALGRRQGRVSHRELEELSRRLDRVRFFERNEYGELPAKPECTTVGNTTSCAFSASVSICTDTSHSIITVNRGRRLHTIDNDHCSDRSDLDAVEDFIDRIANTQAWIGS
jgi:hypothetical protein